jgi:hypothetical protein
LSLARRPVGRVDAALPKLERYLLISEDACKPVEDGRLHGWEVA